MTTVSTTQIYQIFIKASPERVWAAITEPDLTAAYFYGARITNTADRHVSVGPDGGLWDDAEVLEFDPPRRLVHQWQSLYDQDLAGEPPSRVTWEIEAQEGGVCLLTVTHVDVGLCSYCSHISHGPGHN